jgi:outer membrane murein-binding lipoprotein Lpp
MKSLLCLLIVGAAISALMVGCSSDAGPNDPVMKSSDLNKTANDRLTEEERQNIAPPADFVGGGKGKGG